MKIRIVSTVLWFLAGWALTSTIAVALGLDDRIGLVVGLAWGALIAFDPMNLLWRNGAATRGPVAAPPALPAED